MIESFITKIIALFGMIPFSGATWFVLFTLGFFIWLFARASNNPHSLVNWEHLIVDTHSNRASPYKVGFIVGMIVSTWIVITFADAGKLTFDILGTYLTFVLGGAGVNMFSKNKTPVPFPEPKTPVEEEEEEEELPKPCK
jgi:hypothetical protein